MMIDIVADKIDETALLEHVKSESCGAVILFAGTTRRVTNGRITQTLHYEAYGEMARKELVSLREKAMTNFGLEECAIVHRVGEVPLKETSIVVVVSSAHRKQSFEAAAWIMDQVKQDVPIWKQEVWEDGGKGMGASGQHTETFWRADAMMPLKIVDSFGRVHNNLRISVTDRCNIRCFYCMPNENVKFLPQKQILSFEEIQRFTQICSRLGVDRVRVTGGEPLVRSQLEKLIEMLDAIDGINQVALTTNGVLLADQAQKLRDAGLSRINISLDTLNEDTFFKLSRRKGLQRVLQGIDAAIETGFDKIRLNAIAIAGLTDEEIVPLVGFAIKKGLEIRFIEFMPLDAEQNWDDEQVLTGAKIKTIVEEHFGPLRACRRDDPSQPATDFQFESVEGKIGFINPISQPFCQSCNRLRLTSEGKIRNCLFSTSEWDVRGLLRSEASDDDIAEQILDCVQNKKASHGIASDKFSRPEKAMYQIGG